MRWKFSGIVLYLFWVNLSFAVSITSIYPRLIVKKIEVVETGERFGDNLYFDVMVFPVHQATQFYRVPKYPISLSSSKVSQLKPIRLWSATLKSGDKLAVVISLVDQDLNKMNPDDLIGTVRMDIQLTQGRLKGQWSMPNQTTTPIPLVVGSAHVFDLYSADGKYKVTLSLEKS